MFGRPGVCFGEEELTNFDNDPQECEKARDVRWQVLNEHQSLPKVLCSRVEGKAGWEEASIKAADKVAEAKLDANLQDAILM